MHAYTRVGALSSYGGASTHVYTHVDTRVGTHVYAHVCARVGATSSNGGADRTILAGRMGGITGAAKILIIVS